MPRTTVTAIARMNAVRSLRRIPQTSWHVTELKTAGGGPTNGRIARWNGSPFSGSIGGHCTGRWREG